MPLSMLKRTVQIAEQIEQLTDTISSLKDAVQEAVATQKAAKEECKKLEKDMAEFKTNKDGKIEELRVGRLLPFTVPTLIISLGEHWEAKESYSTKGGIGQDTAKGSADSPTGAWYAYRGGHDLLLTLL